jgi:hypothetical protein
MGSRLDSGYRCGSSSSFFFTGYPTLTGLESQLPDLCCSTPAAIANTRRSLHFLGPDRYAITWLVMPGSDPGGIPVTIPLGIAGVRGRISRTRV